MDTAADDEVEISQLDAWRLEQFLALGWKPRQAAELTVYEVDWREAAKLLAAGCPHKFARRILLP